MDSMDVSYERVDAGAVGRKRRSKIVVTVLASALVVAVVVCVGIGITRQGGDADGDLRKDYLRRWELRANAVKDACSTTLYPEFCASTIGNFPGLSHRPGKMEILNAAVKLGIQAVKLGSVHARSLYRPGLTFRQKTALHDCVELFDDTLDELYDTLSDIHNMTFMAVPRHAADLETLLSGAITNQDTCFEGFTLCKGHLKQDLKGGLRNVTHLVSNSLAMVRNISHEATRLLASSAKQSSHNRHLLSVFSSDEDGFPTWMSVGDRRLLQSSSSNITVNAIVAKDGSGHYTTIKAAVDAAPENSKTRHVIHIRRGTYQENVEVHKKKINLMFIGDGKGVTVVTGSLNVKDGSTTFHSATVAITGKAFVARDMTFENTAGPSKHQAVALRVGSDLSAFYRCSFKGYQDTLYVHSLRQFYRECDIHGTVDFIFGNAAVVFQNCNLYARKPMANQKIMYTAQGRQDPNQNTGISIHNCNVLAESDLMAAAKGLFPVYLGRPWKEYSRTVFMQSYLDGIIEPAGFLEWNGTFALSTLYYGEYMNRGPGAGTANRVKWPGYRVISSSAEANQFTVNQFIEGDSWLPSTGVKYAATLTG
uniref:Pectinesterase n=1 Tax=Araucaria cunninghamii TaxID=56994 RepID=A0A0D6QUJ1_ARACU